MSGCDTSRASEGEFSLLYIQTSEASTAVLQRAVRRISRNVRQSDLVLLGHNVCAVVLPGTGLDGAQAVARRVSVSLVDVEYELQAFCGTAAVTLLQRLQAERIVVVSGEVESFETPKSAECQPLAPGELPYLAFLSNYPSPRLLHLFPYELACQYQCVPVGAERGVLTLATSQRLDQAVIAQLRKMTQRGIFQVRCEAGVIADVLSYWQRVIAVENGMFRGGSP